MPTDASGLAAMHELLDRLRDEHPELVPAERLGFRTAVAELVANVIDHAAPTPGTVIRIGASVEPRRIVGFVEASGERVDWQLPADVPDEAERGRGLLLVTALCALEYVHDGGTNRWSLARARQGATDGDATPAG